jgi:hypothetical protein
MLKEYEGSLLDLFGRLYRQTGSFQDQDGNVYLVFERRRFKIFRERVILRRELLEEKESELPGSILYIPKLKSKLKLL